MAASPRSSLPGNRLLSPLNLAAYLTWFAVCLQMLQWRQLLAGDAAQWFGLATLVLFAIAYLRCALLRRSETLTTAADQRGVLTQAVAALLGAWFVEGGGPTILMIIVASQAVALWSRRDALILLALCNLFVLGVWADRYGLVNAVIYLLPLVGFQAFAALTTHFAVSADQARAQLVERNGELLATRQLLQDGTRAEERLKLSRELHDVAGHKLTALKLNLRLLARDGAASAELSTCLNLADELLSDIREVVSALRQHDGIDLPAALELMIDVIPGVDFTLDVSPALRIERLSTAEVLLRVCQEGITNAIRHGRARHIKLSLQQTPAQTVLRIENDGVVSSAIRDGNGLTGMRERVAELGGTLSLDPGAQGGMVLWVAVPKTTE